MHALLQTSQLRHLAQRAEGRLARDSPGDVVEGVSGVAIMVVAFLTPFMRTARGHWELSAQEASSARSGDELIAEQRWSWTHAVELDATRFRARSRSPLASPERVDWLALAVCRARDGLGLWTLRHLPAEHGRRSPRSPQRSSNVVQADNAVRMTPNVVHTPNRRCRPVQASATLLTLFVESAVRLASSTVGVSTCPAEC